MICFGCKSKFTPLKKGLAVKLRKHRFCSTECFKGRASKMRVKAMKEPQYDYDFSGYFEPIKGAYYA